MSVLEELGFNREHRKPLLTGKLDVDYQIVDTPQVFPDLSFTGDKIESLNISKLRAGSLRVDDYIQSTGFVTGTTGWQIKGDGTAEFKDITLVGGTFKYGKTAFTDSTNAGYILSSSGVYVGSAADASYLKYTIGTGAFVFVGTNLTIDATNQKMTLGSGNDIISLDAADATYRLAIGHATYASAPFRVSKGGSVTATDITATGTINATAGYIGTGTALTVESTGLVVGATGHLRGGQTDYATGTGFFIGYSGGAYKLSIGGTGTYLNWDNTILTILGQLTLIELWTAGEDLTSGHSVAIGRDETLYSTDMDSYVYEANPGTNYGNNAQLLIGGSAVGVDRIYSYLKFDLTGIPAGNLTSATLRLNCSTAQNAEVYDVHRATVAWTEAVITWTNKAAYDGTPSATHTMNAAVGWKTWTVTTLVASWLDSTYTNHGIAIIGNGTTAATHSIFSSSEGANSPELVLVFDTGKVFKAVATTATNANRFLGFANESFSADASGKIQIGGRVVNLTGLTVGVPYYLSDTPGLVSNSVGSVTKKIGLSGTTTTELLLLNS